MNRLHEIKRAVTDLSTVAPSTDHSDLMWFKPDRGSPDYYRLVPREGYEERGGYDVWMETDARFDRAGILQVSCEVVLYELAGYAERERTRVFGDGFDGYDQPREQMFLLNLHHYEQQARDVVEEYAATAELWAEHELLKSDDGQVTA